MSFCFFLSKLQGLTCQVACNNGITSISYLHVWRVNAQNYVFINSCKFLFSFFFIVVVNLGTDVLQLPELGTSHAFKTCSQSHNAQSPEFGIFYDIHSLLSTTIGTTPREEQAGYLEQLQEYTATFWNYVGHLLRTKHQGDYYR